MKIRKHTIPFFLNSMLVVFGFSRIMHLLGKTGSILVKDLELLELEETKKSVVGAARTAVYGTVSTGYGSAFSTINSFSVGTQTYTSSIANTRVSRTSFSVTSNAKAIGLATAQSSRHYSSSTARYESTSIYLGYF